MSDNLTDCLPLAGTAGGVLPVCGKDCGEKDIVQSRMLTFSSFRITALQYDILLHLKRGFQNYLFSRASDADFSQPIVVPLHIEDFPSFKRSVIKLYEEVSKFVRLIAVEFSWRFDGRSNAPFNEILRNNSYRHLVQGFKDGETVRTTATLVKRVDYGTDSGTLAVTLNEGAAPFLLYIGQGIGGTTFNLDVSLSLSSMYSKRVYEMISEWSSRQSVKAYSLDEFRQRLQIPDCYDNAQIRRRVLDVARDEIDASVSSLKFKYRLVYDPSFGPSSDVRKKAANAILFTMSKPECVDYGERFRKVIQVMLEGICDKERRHVCADLSQRVVDMGKSSFLTQKFIFYDKKVKSRKMSPAEYRNTLLKIVLETTGVDLRSDAHIRNSMRYCRRNAAPGRSRQPVALSDGFSGSLF